MTLVKEGIFRKPRLRSNEAIKKFAHLFEGDIINVSGGNDSDKNSTLKDYYFGNYDQGKRYKEYFSNAQNYYVSHYPNDCTNIFNTNTEAVNSKKIDLNLPVNGEHLNRYDVVFNHTVLEHVFNIFQAFENLCSMSKDIVILVVPQSQKIHDYNRGYEDYWRFTPFSIEKLFHMNNMIPIYRETTYGFSESMYLIYIASKNPDKWRLHFPKLLPIKDYLSSKNDGSLSTIYSYLIISFESLLRRTIHLLNTRLKKNER